MPGNITIPGNAGHPYIHSYNLPSVVVHFAKLCKLKYTQFAVAIFICNVFFHRSVVL